MKICMWIFCSVTIYNRENRTLENKGTLRTEGLQCTLRVTAQERRGHKLEVKGALFRMEETGVCFPHEETEAESQRNGG